MDTAERQRLLQAHEEAMAGLMRAAAPDDANVDNDASRTPANSQQPDPEPETNIRPDGVSNFASALSDESKSTSTDAVNSVVVSDCDSEYDGWDSVVESDFDDWDSDPVEYFSEPDQEPSDSEPV